MPKAPNNQSKPKSKSKANSYYSCTDCKKSFTPFQRKKFIEHIISHFPVVYECKECDMNFKDSCDLAHHNVVYHNHIICYKCDKTGKPTNDCDQLFPHVCERDEEIYLCDSHKCINKNNEKTVFKKKFNFIEHLIQTHEFTDCHTICEIVEQSTEIKPAYIHAKGLKEEMSDETIKNSGFAELICYANYCVNNGVLYLDPNSDIKEKEIVNIDIYNNGSNHGCNNDYSKRSIKRSIKSDDSSNKENVNTNIINNNN